MRQTKQKFKQQQPKAEGAGYFNPFDVKPDLDYWLERVNSSVWH